MNRQVLVISFLLMGLIVNAQSSKEYSSDTILRKRLGEAYFKENVTRTLDSSAKKEGYCEILYKQNLPGLDTVVYTLVPADTSFQMRHMLGLTLPWMLNHHGNWHPKSKEELKRKIDTLYNLEPTNYSVKIVWWSHFPYRDNIQNTESLLSYKSYADTAFFGSVQFFEGTICYQVDIPREKADFGDQITTKPSTERILFDVQTLQIIRHYQFFDESHVFKVYYPW
ncbi:MAG: hypothetical protein ACKOXB_05010 [Flavobacteriales bacterium]